MRGKFIVIDGGEGTGKTSVIAALKEKYGDSAVYTREPGGTPFAEKIRDIFLDEVGKQSNPLTHFALFWAARRAHIDEIILPALISGKHVICDRFDSSTFAYQIYGQNNLSLKNLFEEMRKVYLNDVNPDLYIYLDLDPRIGMQRTKARGNQNHFDLKDLDFYERVREGYQEFMQKYPSVTIDASVEESLVRQEVIEAVERVLTRV